MSNFDLSEMLPDRSLYENRFNFIHDETLKLNLTIEFRYIIFLTLVTQETDVPGGIIYSIYKDIIVHTASVIESTLSYILRLLMDSEEIKSREVMSFEWIPEKTWELYKIDEENIVCGIIKRRKYANLSKKTQFTDLIEAAKKAKILTFSLAKKIDAVRDMRNKIHLASLDTAEDYYEQKDIIEVFKVTKTFLKHVETLQIKYKV